MLIDQQFINKVCQILTKRIVDFDSSNESQFLGLMLLKEILLIPLAEREPSKKRRLAVRHVAGEIFNRPHFISPKKSERRK